MRDWRTSVAPIAVGLGVLALLLSLFVHWLAIGPLWLSKALAVTGGILILLYPAIFPDKIIRLFQSRSTQAGTNILLMSLIFIGIVGVVNFLGYRYHKRFDLTANKEYSLSPQTVRVLKELPAPVHAIAFFVDQDPRRDRVEDLLREYAQVTNKFTYEFVNPNREPGKARQYGLTRLGVVVLVQGDRREQADVFDEEDLTSAIIRVTRDKPRVVYFTIGHGERDPHSYQDRDLGQAVRKLEQEFYEVRTLSLATITDTLPADMDALVVAGPTQPFTDEELERVFDYLNSGGRVLWMQDPSPNLDISPLNERLKAWGVKFDNDLVLDPQSALFGDIATPLVTRYTFHTITKELAGLATFYPTARSISRVEPAPQDKKVVSLVTTTSRAWGETEYTGQKVGYDKDKDLKGPLTLVSVVDQVKGDAQRGRLVVVGDADFASNIIINSVQGAFANVELFGNMINWLTEDEALVSISPKPPAYHPLRPLTPGEQNVIFFTTTVFLPLLILVAGIIIWWQRR